MRSRRGGCRARQILWLLARRRGIWFGRMSCRERLTIGPIHRRWLPDAAPDCVSWHKCLSLCRNWREDAVLVESQAIGTTTVICCLKAGAANLASSAIAACNGSPLTRCWGLVAMVHVIWRGRLSIRVLLRRWWWGAIPLVRAGQTIGCRLRMKSSHVVTRLGRRRERGSDMRCRRGVCAVGRRLGSGGRLWIPVRRKLTLAVLMGVHWNNGRRLGRVKPGCRSGRNYFRINTSAVSRRS